MFKIFWKNEHNIFKLENDKKRGYSIPVGINTDRVLRIEEMKSGGSAKVVCYERSAFVVYPFTDCRVEDIVDFLNHSITTDSVTIT